MIKLFILITIYLSLLKKTIVVYFPGVNDNCKGVKSKVDKLNSIHALHTICLDYGQDTYIYFPKLIEHACLKLKNIKNLIKNGFVAYGESQGGLLAKLSIQHCDEGIYAKGLLTLSSPLMGVSYIPNYSTYNPINLALKLCLLKLFKYYITVCSYYWETLNLFHHNENSMIGQYNNLKNVNQQYKNRMLNLERFLMIESLEDTTVIPKESSHFGYKKYVSFNNYKIVNYEETEYYKKDTLGLKELYNKGKLLKCKFKENHTIYNEFEFYKIIVPFLDFNKKFDKSI